MAMQASTRDVISAAVVGTSTAGALLFASALLAASLSHGSNADELVPGLAVLVFVGPPLAGWLVGRAALRRARNRRHTTKLEDIQLYDNRTP